MNHLLKPVMAAVFLLMFAQCNMGPGTIPPTLKTLPNDPFQSTITPGQEFTIDARKDNVIEGKSGTIVLCPKGCFMDGNGHITEGNVKIELTEALSVADMLLSNLTTTADGKPLVTDGMLYFNASADGRQLKVNKDIPVHFELPTKNKKAGMMVYKGTRDAAGNMNWTEPKETDKYLVEVDIKLLNFLPPYFEQTVEMGMPYLNHTTATPDLTDSLYYALSVTDGSDMLKGLMPTRFSEPFDNIGVKVKGGKYSKTDYETKRNSDTGNLNYFAKYRMEGCGIDPAIIKTIKSAKYQHTLIATREFEQRLPFLFQSCDKKIIEIYINNLDKNLYELDSIAGAVLNENERNYGDKHLAVHFIDFAKQRLTKVKDADKYAALLKGYYDERMAQVKKELQEAKGKMMVALQQKNVEATKLADDYSSLLNKREKDRMETYGFNWTETGWINMDNGTEPKSWDSEPLEVTLKNGKDFDRAYAYIIYLSMKSLYRLNSTDNTAFYAGNDSDRSMLMPKASKAILVGVGYKGDKPFMSIKEITTGTENKDTLTLLPVTLDSLKSSLAEYDYTGVSENSISRELQYMERFYKEDIRQKKLRKEADFIRNLFRIAYPRCPLEDGYVSEANTETQKAIDDAINKAVEAHEKRKK